MSGVGARSVWIALIALCGVAGSGCLGLRDAPDWGKGAEVVGLDARPAQGFWMKSGGEEIEAARVDILLPLSKVFYERITNRRLNSKASFDDPALREFFRDPTAFADYYANLVEALDRAYFESDRPTSVTLLRVERIDPKRAKLTVRFRGDNRKPLRFWSTFASRTDEWEYAGGRWWIIPGKV